MLFFCYTVKVQISTEENPYSWERGHEKIQKQLIPVETLPNLDMKAIEQNVTVQNSAKLTLDAINTTTINGAFEVKLGSQLEIK